MDTESSSQKNRVLVVDDQEVLLVVRLCGAKLKRWQGAIRAAYHQRQSSGKAAPTPENR